MASIYDPKINIAFLWGYHQHIRKIIEGSIQVVDKQIAKLKIK
jgi:hypothetical protein